MIFIKNIPIEECVHFRGFRYGGFGNNIYEDYIVGLADGVDKRELRLTFVKRVLAFNGLDFSSALDVRLTKKYPAWVYPWTLSSIKKLKFQHFSPEKNPDIICHSSPQGVLASHINREFYWLEQAFRAMSLDGYKPETLGYITVQCMKRGAQTRYLVLDGNHRLSALHSLGVKALAANVRYNALCNRGASRIWPGVLSRRYLHEDAVLIFDRYFTLENLALPEMPRRMILHDESLIY